MSPPARLRKSHRVTGGCRRGRQKIARSIFSPPISRAHRVPLVFTYHTRLDFYAHYAPFERRLARRALAAGLISFASELGATIVAEGIQSRHELDALRALGVRYGQGFYLGRPGPIAEVMTICDLTH